MMLFHDVPLACINQAAMTFHVPATLILSVIKIENGRNGSAQKNKNGSYDLGVMQVNSRWLSTLRRKGVTYQQVKSDPCVNVTVGTWILAKGIANSAGWQGVGNYHSYTLKHNQLYREHVKNIYEDYVTLVRRA